MSQQEGQSNSESSSENEDVGKQLALWMARMLIIFGGVFPFVPQYYSIMKTEDASGFSTTVCLVVVSSSVLRIAYWFGRAFDNALLLQSIIMTIGMMAVLELCIRVERRKAEKSGIRYQEHSFSEFDMDRFWQWTNLSSYIQATSLLFVLSSSYALCFEGREALIEPLGYLALLIESGLALPQFLRNYQKKSTKGMSIMMVVLWTLGDLIKGFFFLSTGQPVPFILCATIQVIMDLALFGQVFLYK